LGSPASASFSHSVNKWKGSRPGAMPPSSTGPPISPRILLP